MKTGTQQIVYKVENILFENHVKNGRRRIANEIVDEVMRLLGDEMNKEWNLGHGFPQELEPMVRKLENGLGLRMKRDERAVEVYQWVVEQEKSGRPVNKFIAWATDRQRVQYVGKYRNSPEAIRVDYKMAFENTTSNTRQAEML